MVLEIITKEEFEQLSQKVDKILAFISNEKSDELFDNDSLAKKLNVCKRTLQHYRDTGQIEFVQKGRKIFYTNEAVNDFLNKNAIKISSCLNDVRNGFTRQNSFHNHSTHRL